MRQFTKAVKESEEDEKHQQMIRVRKNEYP
jgi:hypothetical protein